MKVKELIEKLNEIKNKESNVYYYDFHKDTWNDIEDVWDSNIMDDSVSLTNMKKSDFLNLKKD